MIENPWRHLPVRPPFVLPSDEECVRAFNKKKVGPGHAHFIHLDDILPEAFVGDRAAPVVLLSNNPGYGRTVADRSEPKFVAWMRSNLLHEAFAYPFVFLRPDFSGPGKKWWEPKLKHLLKEFGVEVVARSVLNVVYFPYPSQRYGHGGLPLPSQEYGFQLVREAVKRKAAVVRMRANKGWFEKVPELNGYDRLYRVRNWQSPAISPGNCADYQNVVEAIREAEVRRQAGHRSQ